MERLPCSLCQHARLNLSVVLKCNYMVRTPRPGIRLDAVQSQNFKQLMTQARRAGARRGRRTVLSRSSASEEEVSFLSVKKICKL